MWIAVVDEREDVLHGRIGWLRAAGHTVDGYSFEEALAEPDWQRYEVVVLDGRDDRERPLLLGERALPDRFLGPRVAGRIREVCQEGRPRIVLISAYARTHPELSLRCQEAGVDYAFDYTHVASPELFVRAVESPESMGPRPPVHWQAVGFAAPPRLGEALAEAQKSAATPPLLWTVAATRNIPAYERRRLRERLGQLLPIATYPTGGRRRLVHNTELRPILRRLLGLRPDDHLGDDIRDL